MGREESGLGAYKEDSWDCRSGMARYSVVVVVIIEGMLNSAWRSMGRPRLFDGFRIGA